MTHPNDALEAFTRIRKNLGARPLTERELNDLQTIRAALLDAPETVEGNDLAKRLRIKAQMLQMGERIEYGSDSKLMLEAADALETQSRQSAGDDKFLRCLIDVVQTDWGRGFPGKAEQDAYIAKAKDVCAGKIKLENNTEEVAPQPPASAVDVEAIKCEIWQAIAEKHQNAQGDIRAATVIEVIDHLQQRGLIGQPVGGGLSTVVDKLNEAKEAWYRDEQGKILDLIYQALSILKHHAGE